MRNEVDEEHKNSRRREKSCLVKEEGRERWQGGLTHEKEEEVENIRRKELPSGGRREERDSEKG